MPPKGKRSIEEVDAADKPLSPPAEGSRKKAKKDPPNFSQPGALVKFIIGPGDNPTEFMVHKEFACYHSPVFDVAFNSQFVEGQTQTYRIDDILPGVFRFLVQWMYTQKLDIFQLKDDYKAASEYDDDDDDDEDEDEEQWHTLDLDGSPRVEDERLVSLWVLADRLSVPRLQNYALDRLEEISDKMNKITTTSLKYIYNNTSTGSALRRYFVDACARELNDAAYANASNNFPHAALIDIVIAKGADDRRGEGSARFHVPVDDD